MLIQLPVEYEGQSPCTDLASRILAVERASESCWKSADVQQNGGATSRKNTSLRIFSLRTCRIFSGEGRVGQVIQTGPEMNPAVTVTPFDRKIQAERKVASGMTRATKKKSPRYALRLLAILVGLAPVLVLEGLLRIWDYPKADFSGDPLIDASELKPLFEPIADDPGRMQIGESRLDLFCPAQFDLAKSKKAFRIFALGGSTTYGEPYASETSFPAFVGKFLEAANPNRDIEVINCGGLSYASYRIRFILQEVLEYSPDLILIYTGHNEYLERRSQIFSGTSESNDSESWPEFQVNKLARFKTVQLFNQALTKEKNRRSEVEPTKLAREVNALLDYQGGLEDYQRSKLNRRLVAKEFRFNLSSMIQMCKARNVPLVVVGPVSNLLDTPPFKFENRPDLSEEELTELDRQWELATGSASQRLAEQAAEAVLRIDSEHAGALYLLGCLAANRKDFGSAKELLLGAKDSDVCPLRAPAEIVDVLKEVIQESGTAFVDANEVFEALSEGGIVGKKWLVDHIHPSVEGHRVLAEQIAAVCLDRKTITQVDHDWREKSVPQIEDYLANLDAAYYVRGQQRLAGLRLWTQGRAKKLRNSSSSEDETTKEAEQAHSADN